MVNQAEVQKQIHWLDLYLRLPRRWVHKDYPDEEYCLELLHAVAWPGGPRCRRCMSDNVYHIKTRREWECRDCGKQFSPFIDTIFEETRKPLQTWCILASTMMRAEALHLQGILLPQETVARNLKMARMTARRLLFCIRAELETAGGGLLGAMLCTQSYELQSHVVVGSQDHLAALKDLAAKRQ